MDNIVLICNGEIYNYNDLALDNNITLTTDSDCEVILLEWQKPVWMITKYYSVWKESNKKKLSPFIYILLILGIFVLQNAEGDTAAGFHHTDVHFPIKKEFG